MIKTEKAIATARALLGTPYTQMDCIALIRAVIRRSEGGVGDYRCEGTNWLWRSIDNASKYRHLTWRQESISGAKAGMLAFKRSGEDVHHVGLVTEAGTVIHASSVFGYAVETALDGSWHCLGQHKYIETGEPALIAPEEEKAEEGAQRIVIIDSAGNRFEPIGDFRVLRGSVD